ncbi:DNA polymerase II large subunit [archaeon]|jgi:DNA polymerase II large subunit|nr:DNA polymerase II large subunit [archaeon]MBT6697832.1 DNA polymerase II large subunit [archaeon]
MAPVASPRVQKYFDDLKKGTLEAYKIARQARSKGLDPETDVEIILANTMAERVIGIISIVAPQLAKSNVASRITELEEKYGLSDWRVGMVIAHEVAQQKFCEFKNKIEAMEVGIRTGFSYLTQGIVAAPLEGFIGLKLKKRKDGKEYFAIQYAGPVRGAGGTASSVSVIISDYVRVKMGYSPWDPDEKEINRYVLEINDYHERVTNLQYRPSNEELKFMISKLPVEVDGDPTERIEVSNYKDIPRIETNLIRGGMCLVVAEGLCQKSKKLNKRLEKWGKDMELNWGFMTDFLKLKGEIHARSTKEKEDKKAKELEESSGDAAPKVQKVSKRKSPKANDTFVADIVAGRPVITHPLAIGGLRLRYGRGRTSGFSASAIHPATLVVMDDYFAIGTQCKVERPGKATSLTLCDTIEGPIVKLKNGDVVQITSQDQAKEIRKEIDQVLFLGDILFNYGDFSENGHKLVPAGYCPEWWALELEKAIMQIQKIEDEDHKKIDYDKVTQFLEVNDQLTKEQIKNSITKPLYHSPNFGTAILLSEKLDVPLHPIFIDHWRLISIKKLQTLINYLKEGQIKKDDEKNTAEIILPFKPDNKLSTEAKEVLEEIGMPHKITLDSNLIISDTQAKTFLYLLKINSQEELKDLKLTTGDYEDALDYFEQNAKIKIKDKSGTFIGARMGRPEKAKMRAMKGRPHMLFPVGEEGGRMKSIQGALDKGKGKITSQFNKDWLLKLQEDFGDEIIDIKNNNYDDYATVELNIKNMFHKTLKKLNMKIYPDLIKGVKVVSNRQKIPENLIKGIYRAKYEVAVNKDGTTRYDCTELPLTHFKPKEIGTSITKLKNLGYTHDIRKEPLTNTNQILEILPQDIVLPHYEEIEDGAGSVLLRVSKFIDDILTNFYDLPAHYNAKTKEDLVGHLVIGLAPHISAGTVGRIIGYSNTQGLLTHPMYHAGMRRDCDGDEAAILLLLDGLINFSKKYLPSSRGSTMDAALVLTPNLNPAEVDDQVLGIDVQWRYPLELYEGAQEMKAPWDIRWGKDQKKIAQLDHRIGTEKQYEDFGFTHDVDDFNDGVKCSAYKTVPSMKEKLFGQMEIARKLRAVDMDQVARLVIQKHFLADIKGNFRKFSMQGFRCTNCNTKYRRPPVSGRCTECKSLKSKIIFTISQGSVVKYLEMSLELCDQYDFSPYLKQTIHILKQNIDVVFGKVPDKQVGLGQFI